MAFDPPARSTGEFRNREFRHDGRPAVLLCQRHGGPSRPGHSGGAALPHRVAPRIRDAEPTAGFGRHRGRGLSNDQGRGTGHSQHAGNGVVERFDRRGHLHAAGGRRRSPEQAGQLGRYIHDTEEIDPQIRLAVMQYQFKAIHPFVDGNDRTGRVLNLLYLVDKGLLDVPVLYLSRNIIRNSALYCRYLSR